ncbi:MAG TPA: Uma2 family endonuclease [Planctomycetota bacterium]|nr:Uma2 family endonuclease [Planctomycetota bacterium]
MKAKEEPAPYGASGPSVIHARGVWLHNISWETFVRLVDETGNERKTRFAYLDGDLEIMSPLPIHERYNRLLQLLVVVLAEETESRVVSLGSLTCKLEAAKVGLEPDSCFYFQHIDEILGLEKIDMEKHPAPDLVIEIDITNTSMNKFPIYDGLKVPEVWRHDGEKLHIYHRERAQYVERDRSLAFPTLKIAGILTDLLSRSHCMDDLQVVQEFRKAIRQHLKA